MAAAASNADVHKAGSWTIGSTSTVRDRIVGIMCTMMWFALLAKVPDLDDDTMHDLLEHVHDPVNPSS